MIMYGVEKKSSDSQPYRAVHLGSVFIWGVTSSTVSIGNKPWRIWSCTYSNALESVIGR